VRTAPFTGDETLPAQSEVVVIGGGINGVIAAWHLAREGVPVLLCEKAEIGCEASGRAFGWISELMLDPCKMELCRASKAGWAELQREVGETGYRVEGLCYLAADQAELDQFAGWLDSVHGTGAADSLLLTAGAVRERFPAATTPWAGGLYAPSDGSAEPQLAAPTIAAAARRGGARIVTQCAVRGLERANGRVSAVITERGVVRTSKVICATNAWSRFFLGNLGIDVPQLWVMMSMGCIGPLDGGPVGCGGRNEWAWRRQIDGGYSLGGLGGQRFPVTRDSIRLFSRFVPILKVERPFLKLSFGPEARRDWRMARHWKLDAPAPFETVRILEPEVDRSRAQLSLRQLGAEFPSFRRASVTEAWSGVITVTPDNLPIASAVERVPGLFLITGCAYGLTWAPALARLVVDELLGRAPALDARPYRLGRFFDGSPLHVTH